MTDVEPGTRPLTATVAFLFADLEGSTRLLASLGADSYREVLSGYRMVITEAAAPEGGEVVDREGDGLFLVFPTAAGALRAAAHGQRALARHDWPAGADVAARIGIHAGEARRDREGMIGLDVHRAARVASAAHGGQVLVSEAARLLALEGLPDDLQLRDLGEHRLKDMNRPERLHQLVIAGLRHHFPALRTLESAHHNLPVQATSFVGRQAEMAQLGELVHSSRFVTITGVGGSGKTRLALHVAADSATQFRDGVWLVELGGVTDPERVDGAVLAALGLTQDRGVEARETVLSSLASWTAMIVLDNCEHLLDAAADLVTALLAAAPGVSIVATSRELLGVAGETVYALRPMSLPTAGQPAVGETLASYDAVRLFTERAAAVLPGFTLNAANASAIAEICRRLDGMPLALELAAPRLRTFSPDKLAALLDQRFRLLTGGSRTAVPRQQTLNATIEWSYRLLDEAEQAFFRRLSVFHGGFTYEAAAAACAWGEVDETDVIELLPALVDKSLVVADSEAGEVRYRLLETLRQFASERLDESGQGLDTRRRHADFFGGLARQAAQHAVGPDERAWRARVVADADNLRQAMTWLIETDQAAAVEMAISFAHFSGWSEGISWIERAWPSDWPSDAGLLRARALSVRGQMRDEAGRFEEAAADIEQSISLFRQLEAEGVEPASLIEFPRYAGAYLSLAAVLFHHGRAGDNNEALTRLVQEGLVVARRLGDDFSIATALTNLAHHMDPAGDPDAARQLFTEAVAATRALGSDRAMASVSQQRAFFEFQAGDRQASRAAWRAAIEHAERADLVTEAHVLRAYLAATEVELGIDSVASFAFSVRSLFDEPGTRQAAWVYQPLIVFRAGIDSARRDHQRVAVAAGASAAETERGTPLRWDLVTHFERVTGEARAALGAVEFASGVQRGRALNRDEIAQFLVAD